GPRLTTAARCFQAVPYSHGASDDFGHNSYRRRRGRGFRSGTGRPVLALRAGLRPQGIPEQDRAFVELRCGREASAGVDPGILRLLRLAFERTRPLAADAICPPVSPSALSG